MPSSLDKAIERFDKLTEKQLSAIARKMIKGAIRVERKAKRRKAKAQGLRKA